MTQSGHGGGLPPGPPWPLDLLADLHAGLLEPAEADELRRHVATDPDAGATLAALDATQHVLATLPAPRMPEDVAARIDAAIAAEAAARAAVPTTPVPAQAPAPVVDLAAARARRRRGLMAGAGLLTAAAAAVTVVAVVNLSGPTTDGTPGANASPSSSEGPSEAPLALTSDNLGGALNEALGATDYGPLAGAGRIDACLAANGITGGPRPVGAREVTLDGRPGVLVVLPAGSAPPRWRLLVVGPDCGPGDPATLADTTTG